jgi:hypothetical protein
MEGFVALLLYKYYVAEILKNSGKIWNLEKQSILGTVEIL